MRHSRRQSRAETPTATPRASTVKLYRAVSEAEFRRTLREAKFSVIPGSLEAKWFAETPQDAAEWGLQFERSSNIMHRFILEVELTEAVARRLMRLPKLDGIGPARCATLKELRGARIKEYKP